MTLLWNAREGRLRALWRLILQALVMGILVLVPILGIAEPVTALHRRGYFLPGLEKESYDRIINMIVGPLLVAAVVGSVAIGGRRLDHRCFVDFTGQVDRRWWMSLGWGFALGGFLMTLAFAVEHAAGWIVVSGFWTLNIAGLAPALALAFSFEKVVCVGVCEEFLSRGYHLRNLAESVGLPVAVVVSSAIFALLHLFNENGSAVSTAGLFVNSVLFAAARVATGRLSTPIGLHIAWNLFEGAVFGFPVSGDKEGASLVGIQQLGPAVLTGGAFGPEGGLIGVAVSLVGIALFAFLSRRTLARAPDP